MNGYSKNPKMYEVEDIKGVRVNSQGSKEYLVKWKGYPNSQATWEDARQLGHCCGLIRQFEKDRNKYNSYSPPEYALDNEVGKSLLWKYNRNIGFA